MWISPQRVLIEARMRPEPETSLAFTGAFAQAIGAKSISLTVVEHRHSGLVYRFSDAMLCSWAVSEETYEKAQAVLADMKDHCLGPRCRIFLASSSPSVRQTLAKIFDPNRFDLNFALQKQSIVDEPKYFSPDVIFIDSAFFGPEQINFIKQAMANIGDDVPIYVLGKSIERVELQARFPGKNFTVLGGIQARLSDLVYQKYLDSVTKDRQSADQDAIHLSPNHPFATLKVQMSARTHVLSRGGMSFGVSSSLGLHGICQVESPLFTKVLGRSPYVKIHAAVAHAETEDHHSRVYESFYSNLSAKERYDLGVGLADYIAQKFVEADAAQFAPLAKVAGDSLALPTSRVSQPPPQQQQANLALVPTSAESPPIKSDKKPLPVEDDVLYASVQIKKTVHTIVSETKEVFASQAFKISLALLAASIFALSVIWASQKYIAPQWQKSGQQYIEVLKKTQEKDNTPVPSE